MPAGSPFALDVIWDSGNPGVSPSQSGQDIDHHFDGIRTAYSRSGWDDPDPVYVGFKGGHNEGHHVHLDLGTFVFEGIGERWAIEPGPGDYGLPGYFDNDVTDDVMWPMHTRASIVLDGKTMTATILNPDDGIVFSMRSAEQDPPQQPNTGINVLTIELASGAEACRPAVLFGFGEDMELPSIVPFSS